MNHSLRRIAVWLPLAAWFGVIFLLSAQPSPVLSPDPTLDVIAKKLGHALIYAVTGILAWWALRNTTQVARPAGLAVFIAFAIAASDELHQAFVDGRHAAWTDVLLDTVAAFAAVSVARWWLERRASKGAERPNG